jgi:hypothetical protein
MTLPVNPIDPVDPDQFVARFTFTRTQGPTGAQGNVDIGTYYTIASNRATGPTHMYLGLGGYVGYVPPLEYGLEFRELARSNPVAMQMGTTTRRSILLTDLFYSGKSLDDCEEFILNAPSNLGPYKGTLDIYNSQGLGNPSGPSGPTGPVRSIPNCYFKQFIPRYDGAKNFVEYDLLFEAASV